MNLDLQSFWDNANKESYYTTVSYALLVFVICCLLVFWCSFLVSACMCYSCYKKLFWRLAKIKEYLTMFGVL